MRRALSISILTSILLSNTVWAGDAYESIIEVTGQLNRNSAHRSINPSQVLSFEEIQTRGVVSAEDLIRGFAGIDVTRQGGFGGLTFISMRGGDPNFTVVMIDGVNVNDTTNSRGGGFDFTALDPLSIERVEVFFGALSPIYGSDSLGGVISIRTRQAAADRSLEGTLEFGGEDNRAAMVSGTATLSNRVSLGATASARNAEGGGGYSRLKRDQININLGTSTQTAFSWRTSLFGASVESGAFPEDSGGDRLAAIRTLESREIDQYNGVAGFDWDINQRWNAHLSGRWSMHQEESINPGIAPGTFAGVPALISDSEHEKRSVQTMHSFKIDTRVSVAVGAEIIQEQGEISSLIDFGIQVPANFAIDRDTSALFGEIAFAPSKKLNVTFSTRYDDAGSIDEVTSRISVSTRPFSLGPRFTLQWSEGFKLPSLFALGHPLVGNSSLKPELSENFELKLAQTFYGDSLKLSLSAFENVYSNLIDFDPLLFTNVNRSEITARGSEFVVQAAFFEKLSLGASISYLSINVDAGELPLRRRPKWKGSADLAYRINKNWKFSTVAIIQDSFVDSSVPTGLINMSGYSRMDMGLHWKFSPKIGMRFLVENVADSSYEETVGFQNPGRLFRFVIQGRI